MKKIYFLLLLTSAIASAQRFDWVKFIAPVGNATASGAAHDMVRDTNGNL